MLRIPGLWVPLVNLQGVYILPGIPRLFRRMVEAHKTRFQGPAASTAEFATHKGEGDIAGKSFSLANSSFPPFIQHTLARREKDRGRGGGQRIASGFDNCVQHVK